MGEGCGMRVRPRSLPFGGCQFTVTRAGQLARTFTVRTAVPTFTRSTHLPALLGATSLPVFTEHGAAVVQVALPFFGWGAIDDTLVDEPFDTLTNVLIPGDGSDSDFERFFTACTVNT